MNSRPKRLYDALYKVVSKMHNFNGSMQEWMKHMNMCEDYTCEPNKDCENCKYFEDKAEQLSYLFEGD